jgi:hypothetical protein
LRYQGLCQSDSAISHHTTKSEFAKVAKRESQ